LFRVLGRSSAVWLAVGLSVTLMVTGAMVAGAAVTRKVHQQGNGGRGPVICRRDGRRTVKSGGVAYIIRNDVIGSERECIRLEKRAVGFTVTKSQAYTLLSGNEAFPEVFYGCEWGVCTRGSVLPARVYRITHLVTSWSTSWRRVTGKFNVAYDIWFSREDLISGQPRGAELMIWLGAKGFAQPSAKPVRVDGRPWWYAQFRQCDRFGCWN
jgi:hypothetical protein